MGKAQVDKSANSDLQTIFSVILNIKGTELVYIKHVKPLGGLTGLIFRGGAEPVLGSAIYQSASD